MPDAELAMALITKAVWSFVGGVIALIVIPPKTRGEALRRGVASVVAGAVSGITLREWLGISETADNIAFATALAAFVSWWILGALPRIAEAFASRKAND